jgi:hypothetical protein
MASVIDVMIFVISVRDISAVTKKITAGTNERDSSANETGPNAHGAPWLDK